MMRKALVTGGAGFIGSHLSKRLVDDGFKVTIIDNLYTGSRRNIAELEEKGDVKFIKLDVSEAKAEEFAKENFDEIYNLACPASPVHYQATPLKTALTSFYGVLFSLELARLTGAKLMHASTSEIYGDPLLHPQEEHQWGNVNTIGIRSCYDEGKRFAETLVSDYIRVYDIDARMIRIFNTYGPKMHPQDGRVVSNFIVEALEGRDITIYGDGSQTRSFQFVSDLVEAIRKYMRLDRAKVKEFFCKNNLPAPVLNIGNPSEYTVKELAAKTLEKLPESPSRLVFESLPGDDPKKRRPDITLAKALLGWEPKITLDEGLDKTIEYFRAKSNNKISID